MKQYLLWGIFIFSGGFLTVLLLRNRYLFRWLGYLCLHAAVASVLLYIINLFSAYTHLEIPLNTVTITTVGLLGVPGLIVLAALKLWVVV